MYAIAKLKSTVSAITNLRNNYMWEKFVPNSIKVGRRDNLELVNSLTFQFISHFLVEILLCQTMGKMNLFHMWHMITHLVEALWHPGFGLSYLNRLTAKSWITVTPSLNLVNECLYRLSEIPSKRMDASLQTCLSSMHWQPGEVSSMLVVIRKQSKGRSCSWNVVWPLLLQWMWSVQGISSYNKKKLAKR